MRNSKQIVRRNVCNTKQTLYESIMSKIAPVVKQALNEISEDTLNSNNQESDDVIVVNGFKLSKDKHKNFIFNYLNDNYKVSFSRGDKVDDFITKDRGFFYDEIRKRFSDALDQYDDIYVMKCWNEGHLGLDKNSKYRIAEFIYHSNNTETQWAIVRNRKRYNVYAFTRGNYGMPNSLKLIGTFYENGFNN